jgi:uncharacterized protein CbrC (UPF0167 family)
MERLPVFRYHPDPVGTGNIQASQNQCRCCQRNRGYVYTGPVYAQDELREALCPWCIASGEAAEKFDAVFSDDQTLIKAGLPIDTVAEVTRRTPGFTGWQQEAWLVHCGDACAFHGDAPANELLTAEARSQLAAKADVPPERWAQFVEAYVPGGDPAVYLFRCIVCGARRFHMDFS